MEAAPARRPRAHFTRGRGAAAGTPRGGALRAGGDRARHLTRAGGLDALARVERPECPPGIAPAAAAHEEAHRRGADRRPCPASTGLASLDRPGTPRCPRPPPPPL